MLVTGEATGSFRFAFSPSKLDSCPAKIRNIAVKIAQKQQINATQIKPTNATFIAKMRKTIFPASFENVCYKQMQDIRIFMAEKQGFR